MSKTDENIFESGQKVCKKAQEDEKVFPEEMFESSLQSLVDLANSEPMSEMKTNKSEKVNPSNPSELVKEIDQKIRFSIHFDARKNQQENKPKFLDVKEDLFKVKQDIHELKHDLKSAERPLMVTTF